MKRNGWIACLVLALLVAGGLAPRAQAESATGGTVTNYTLGGTNFTAHIFTNSGTFTNLTLSSVEVLVVAGGGGAGGSVANAYGPGGGGAGGFTNIASYAVAAGSNYTVTVGAGGAGGPAGNNYGANGSNSSFGAIIAYGGGGGAGNGNTAVDYNGNAGGSGGGGSKNGTGGACTNGQGNLGGAGTANSPNYGGGGGGGSSSTGKTPVSASYTGGAGGAGTTNSVSGSTNVYAAGGVGGNHPFGTAADGINALPNTGNGGNAGNATGSSAPKGGDGGSGIVIVRYYVAVDPNAPAIQNESVTAVTTTSATFNGTLTSTGTSASAVCVYWGTDTNAWANTNCFNGGVADPAWTNNTPFSTNITSGISPNTTYYYTYGASNTSASVVATGVTSFITGALTVQATDANGRASPSDTAAFTVYRPASCTNEDVIVNYTLGGTATNGADYTIAPASGAVVIAKGSTNGLITVTPVFRYAAQQTVILTLTSGSYVIGSANTATCTLATVFATGGTVTNYTLGGTNFTAHIFTNSGTFTNFTLSSVEVLVVAGGGGGGFDVGGGGGAGGLIYSNAFTVVASSNYTVTVGGGGAGDANANGSAGSGANSVFGSLTAVGGGGGGSYNTGSGATGGSGGGGSGYDAPGSPGNGTAGQGNNGGATGSPAGAALTGSGGGGAGGVGGTGVQNATGFAPGGVGLTNWSSGSPVVYATGGKGGGDGWTGEAAGAANTGNGGDGAGASPGRAGGSGIVIVRYYEALPILVPPAIQNQPVTAVTTASATFNGTLTSTGTSATAVCVYWGTDTNAWANTNWFNGGVANAAWTNNTPFSTNITSGISPDTTYYYTYGASNTAGSVVATGVTSFITGALTVLATDTNGRANPSDTAAFTVYRPATCTNEDVIVNYTLGGTATNGADYTIAPASGAVVIAKGSTNGLITVTPVFRDAAQQTVILTLTSGFYAIGSANTATCTLATVVVKATGGTVTNYTLGGTNFTAHIFTNSGTFTNLTLSSVEVLVVAGGGGGGYDVGGGGGAGGLIYSNAFTVVASSNYTVTVGGGGAGGTGNNPILAGNGSNSVFGTLTAIGGGGGGSYSGGNGANGGSGGGGSGHNTTGSPGNGTAGQGNNGGATGSPAGTALTSSGGGGAGGVGGTGVQNATGFAPGGVGLTNWSSGSPVVYATGGAGGGDNWAGPAAGAANTGNGGDGQGNQNGEVGRAGGSGIVIVRYYDALPILVPPAIQNQPVTAVTTASATFNGMLTSTGASASAVCVYWGTDTNAWANTNCFNGGVANPAWTNNTPFSTNITSGISPDTTYYYTYGASNTAGSVVATGVTSFITGALTVLATDANGRANPSDTAAFTVYRPATCTNEDVIVNYTLGGTATTGADYTIAPASGTVVIAKGSTNGLITVTPVFHVAAQQTVILTLTSGFYAIGSANTATCTLATVVALAYTWDASGGAPLNDGGGSWAPTGGSNWVNASTYSAWGNNLTDTATIGVNNGGAGTIIVGTVNAGGITFNAPGSGNYTLTSGTITLNLGSTINVNASATIDSAITGTTVNVSGSSTLTLGGANTFNGLLTINSGATVRTASSGALGSGSSVLVNSGGCLLLQSGGATYSQPLTLNGTGVSNGGALRGTSNTELLGGITLGSSALINSANGGSSYLSLTGTITLNTFDVTFRGGGGGGGVYVEGTATITGSGKVIFDGESLRLRTANTFTGGLLYNSTSAGAICYVEHATALGLAASATVTFGSGAQGYVGLSVDPTIVGLNTDATPGSPVIKNQTGARTLTVNNATANTFAGSLQDGSGALSLIKGAAGTLTLSGNNSYTGSKTINAGMLVAAHTNALGTAGTITVNNSGTLGIAAGVTLTRAVTFNSGSGLAINFTADGSAGKLVAGSLLDLSTGTHTLVLRGTIKPGSYVVASATSVSGTFNTVDTSGLDTTTLDTTPVSVSYPGNGTVVVSVRQRGTTFMIQ